VRKAMKGEYGLHKKEDSNCLEQETDGVNLLDGVLIMFGKSRFKA
jgi:hypothetical protein